MTQTAWREGIVAAARALAAQGLNRGSAGGAP